MKKILIFFVFAIFRVESVNEDLDCKEVEKTPTARLDHHLFCAYEGRRPSYNETTRTITDIRMFPTKLEFAESKGQLNFFAWFHMSWLEPKFVWVPEKYDNIKETPVHDWRIWTPDLMLLNRENNGERKTKMSSRECLVFFNGTINCVVPTKFSSSCEPDYSDWPYDKHYCNVIFMGESFKENGEPMTRLKFNNDSIIMYEFTPNRMWLAHISASKDHEMRSAKNGTIAIYINVTLERRGSRLAIVYILPIVVLMIMTFIALCLDSQSIERVMVASVNFIGHLLALSDLHYYFPTNGSETMPKLLTFYQASVGIAAFVLFLTCLLRQLRETEITAPTWLVRIVSLILCSPVRSLLRLNGVEHKREAEESGNNGQPVRMPKDRTWNELATILEWTSIAIVLLIYIIMLAVVLPSKGPIEHVIHYWY